MQPKRYALCEGYEVDFCYRNGKQLGRVFRVGGLHECGCTGWASSNKAVRRAAVRVAREAEELSAEMPTLHGPEWTLGMREAVARAIGARACASCEAGHVAG